MRRLAPYAGIALAVAVGIFLAPYLGWIALGTVLFLAACVGVALLQRAWRRLMARTASPRGRG